MGKFNFRTTQCPNMIIFNPKHMLHTVLSFNSRLPLCCSSGRSKSNRRERETERYSSQSDLSVSISLSISIINNGRWTFSHSVVFSGDNSLRLSLSVLVNFCLAGEKSSATENNYPNPLNCFIFFAINKDHNVLINRIKLPVLSSASTFFFWLASVSFDKVLLVCW